MANRKDIYNATTDTTIRNGSIVVNPGSPFLNQTKNGCHRTNTSYANENIPSITSISGKYGVQGTGRFNDRCYYTEDVATSYTKVVLDEQNYGGLPKNYWPVDEKTGTVVLNTINSSNTGLYKSSPLLNQIPGPIALEDNGYALFNGIASCAKLGTLGTFGASMGSGITIEFWMRASSLNSGIESCFIGNNAQGVNSIQIDATLGDGTSMISCSFYDKNSKLLSFTTRDNQPSIYNGVFHHIVCRINIPIQIIEIYIDGISMPMVLSNGDIVDTFGSFTRTFHLGASTLTSNLPTAFFNGGICRVAMYDYILSDSRILAHYLAGVNGIYKGVKFDSHNW